MTEQKAIRFARKCGLRFDDLQFKISEDEQFRTDQRSVFKIDVLSLVKGKPSGLIEFSVRTQTTKRITIDNPELRKWLMDMAIDQLISAAENYRDGVRD